MHLCRLFPILIGILLATMRVASGQPWNASDDASDVGASAAAEQSLTRLKVRTLARATPVCLAYVSNGDATKIAPKFRFALKLVLAELKKSTQRVSKISLIYARGPRTTNAQVHAGNFQEYLKLARGATVTKDALADLPTRPLCGEKPTILIHNNSVAFYSRALPTASIWGGSISVYDVLIIRLQ